MKFSIIYAHTVYGTWNSDDINHFKNTVKDACLIMEKNTYPLHRDIIVVSEIKHKATFSGNPKFGFQSIQLIL